MRGGECETRLIKCGFSASYHNVVGVVVGQLSYHGNEWSGRNDVIVEHDDATGVDGVFNCTQVNKEVPASPTPHPSRNWPAL